MTRFIDQDIGVVSTKTHLHHDLKISSTFVNILSNVGDHYLNTIEWTYPFVPINVHILLFPAIIYYCHTHTTHFFEAVNIAVQQKIQNQGLEKTLQGALKKTLL